MSLTPQQAEELRILEERARRREARTSMRAWARLNGYEPALHHALLCDTLEWAARTPDAKFIFCLPRGAAKSTYGSKLYPPFFLAQRPDLAIIAYSHNKDLIQGFGRNCRNLVESHSKVLGYTLRRDSKAADDWGVSNGGSYFCAGVGAGTAGHRGDLGLIDDYFGSIEQADSDTEREHVWDWYWNDFVPCLRPHAAQGIIATRWHEDDLIGRLLAKEGHLWRLISVPFIAKDQDPIGREPGERLWPGYYDDEMERRARAVPRVFLAQYQQEPSPEDGDFFKKESLRTYDSLAQLPKELRIYVGSDHAVTKREEGDKTCMVPVGVDTNGELWVLPSPMVWKRLAADEAVDAMFDMAQSLTKAYGALWWVAEKEKITQCLGPFLFKKMRNEGEFFVIEQVTPKRDKRWRANTLQALCNAGQVHFPSFASWWPAALRELLAFDNLGEDDFVDALAHVARKINAVAPASRAAAPEPTEPPAFDIHKDLTMAWIKDGINHRERQNRLALQDD